MLPSPSGGPDQHREVEGAFRPPFRLPFRSLGDRFFASTAPDTEMLCRSVRFFFLPVPVMFSLVALEEHHLPASLNNPGSALDQ